MFLKRRLVVGILTTLIINNSFSQTNSSRPNVIIFFMDDMGYADASCYGATGFKTPNIDALANAGVRFTDFYVAQPICTASRAALLSGNYPNRMGMGGIAYNPGDKAALPPNLFNLPKLFKESGYSTHLVGKWHLGSDKRAWPLRYGFDQFFGIPYSADMWQYDAFKNPAYPELPLIWNDSIVVNFRDQSFLARWFTQQVEGTIEKYGDKPFFLMMNHALPHVPVEVSPFFQGSSKTMYGDMMQELDWSVGQIVAALKKKKLYENTIIMFLSDNGPWRIFGNHAGSTGNLRGSKGTTFEGGIRVPFIASWPARIPANKVCREYAMTIDLLPTFAAILNKQIPAGNTVDGKNILPLLTKSSSKTPHEALFFYYKANDLEAVRYKNWKLHYPHEYRDESVEPANDGLRGVYHRFQTPLALYDLSKDPGEKNNMAAENPAIINIINKLADSMREDLGDNLTKKEGRNRKPAYKVE